MRNFESNCYIDLIENTTLFSLKKFIKDEINFLKTTPSLKRKSFIDLGAGHGRLIPYFYDQVNAYYSIEINPKMFNELLKRSDDYNAKAFKADFLSINRILPRIKEPLLVLAQNTIGTLEGDLEVLLKELSIFLKNNGGELVISFLKAEAMKDFGENELFPHIKEMIGDIDYEKSDLAKGRLETSSGYTSIWRNEEEINYILNQFGLDVKQSLKTDIYEIYYLA